MKSDMTMLPISEAEAEAIHQISCQLKLLASLSLAAGNAEIKAKLIYSTLEPIQAQLSAIYDSVTDRQLLPDCIAQKPEPFSGRPNADQD